MELYMPKRIETDRLLLRPHVLDDVGPFIQFMTDKAATRYLQFEDEQRTESGARKLLEYVVNSNETENPVFALAVIDKRTGTYMGSCGLAPLQDEEGVECYYSLLPKYWGWGFATEAVMALLYYAFQELELDKVVANMSLENPRAWKVAENAGMRDQGERKHKHIPPAKHFSITRGEYRALF